LGHQPPSYLSKLDRLLCEVEQPFVKDLGELPHPARSGHSNHVLDAWATRLPSAARIIDALLPGNLDEIQIKVG
jgi:hypothetical protein